MTTLPNHWGFIAASYALVIGTTLILGVSATIRLRRARARLAQIDTRRTKSTQTSRAAQGPSS